MAKVYRFETYVPVDSLDKVKTALVNAGAGKYGKYDSCMWQTKGLGQFRPLSGSNPTIGNIGNIETVEEYKLEMIVELNNIGNVIKALKDSHPYEVPAYQFWEVFIDYNYYIDNNKY